MGLGFIHTTLHSGGVFFPKLNIRKIMDHITRLIATSCYGHDAITFTNIFRGMVKSFHVDHASPATSSAVALLSRASVDHIPAASVVVNDGEALYDTYRVQVSTQPAPYIFTWKSILAQGSYNDVYRAVIKTRCDNRTCDKEHDQKAVIKVTSQAPKDLRVYLMENVIHAILNQLPAAKPYVVFMFCPFKLFQNTHPEFKLGCVLEDPGSGDMASFICERSTDETLFSIMTQIGIMLSDLQSKLRFQHRDFKADNLVMTVVGADTTLSVDVPGCRYTAPSRGIGCKMIDFGMTRFELDGEYFGCDVYHQSTTFNPSQDIQYWVATTLEDFGHILRERCPGFYKWLAKYGTAISNSVRARCKEKQAKTTEEKNYYLGETTERECIPAYTPACLLRSLESEWKKIHRRPKSTVSNVS